MPLASLAVAAVVGPNMAYGQNTWRGGTSNAWSTSTNWTSGAVPTSTTPVVFDGSITNQPTITSAASAQGITVLNPSAAVTGTVTSTLTLSGGIDMSAAQKDLQLGVSIGSGTVLLNASGTLSVGQNRTLTIGTRNLNFSNSSATYGIEGPGGVVVSGTTTFGAPTTIRSGSFLSTLSGTVTQSLTVAGGYFSMNNPDGTQNFILNPAVVGATAFSQTSGTTYITRLQIQKAAATISGGTAFLGGLQMGTVSSATSTLTISGSAVVSGTWGNTGGSFGSAASAVAAIQLLSGGTLTMPTMPTTLGSGATRSISFDGGVFGPRLTGATLIQTTCNAPVTNNGAFINTFGLNASIPAVLSDAPGASGPLTKLGSGTLTLGGVNTFSGTATVAGGTLLVTGTGNLANTARAVVNGSGAELAWLSSATLPAPVDVTVGTLSGTGVLGGLVSVASGGILSAGTAAAAPGTLTANGGLALDTSAVLNFDLNATNTTAGGGINDLIVVGGNFTLGGILNVSGAGDWTTVADNTTWRLFDYSGGSFTASAVTLGTQPTLGAGKSFAVDTSTSGQVNLVVIPEPTTATIAIAATIGMAVLVGNGRRRST